MIETRCAVRTVSRGLVAAGLFMALGLSVVVAQSAQQQKVNVKFGFSAAGQDLPAGSYWVKTAKSETGQLELVLVGKDTKMRLPVVTRLAPAGGTTNSTRFVFDSVDGKHTLSEVWVPAYDGFLVNAAKEEHKHEVVEESGGN